MKINQPSAWPTNKVMAGGVANGTIALVVAVAKGYGIELDPEFVAAVMAIASFVVQYMIRNEAPATQ